MTAAEAGKAKAADSGTQQGDRVEPQPTPEQLLTAYVLRAIQKVVESATVPPTPETPLSTNIRELGTRNVPLDAGNATLAIETLSTCDELLADGSHVFTFHYASADGIMVKGNSHAQLDDPDNPGKTGPLLEFTSPNGPKMQIDAIIAIEDARTKGVTLLPRLVRQLPVEVGDEPMVNPS